MLCVVSALVGWLFKSQLTVLDVEHAVALACGIAAMRYGSRLPGARTITFERFRRPLRAPALARRV
jgi:hypothetical protein